MSKVISAEVSDELLEEIDAERDGEPPDYDENRSPAVRRLLRAGIEAKEQEERPDALASAFIMSGMVGVLLGLSGELTALATVLAGIALVGGFGLRYYGEKVNLP
mgnify:CR=1 FL=1